MIQSFLGSQLKMFVLLLVMGFLPCQAGIGRKINLRLTAAARAKYDLLLLKDRQKYLNRSLPSIPSGSFPAKEFNGRVDRASKLEKSSLRLAYPTLYHATGSFLNQDKVVFPNLTRIRLDKDLVIWHQLKQDQLQGADIQFRLSNSVKRLQMALSQNRDIPSNTVPDEDQLYNESCLLLDSLIVSMIRQLAAMELLREFGHAPLLDVQDCLARMDRLDRMDVWYLYRKSCSELKDMAEGAKCK